jgi:hypothetical protein
MVRLNAVRNRECVGMIRDRRKAACSGVFKKISTIEGTGASISVDAMREETSRFGMCKEVTNHI